MRKTKKAVAPPPPPTPEQSDPSEQSVQANSRKKRMIGGAIAAVLLLGITIGIALNSGDSPPEDIAQNTGNTEKDSSTTEDGEGSQKNDTGNPVITQGDGNDGQGENTQNKNGQNGDNIVIPNNESATDVKQAGTLQFQNLKPAKPVNVGNATDRTPELTIPAKINLVIEPEPVLPAALAERAASGFIRIATALGDEKIIGRAAVQAAFFYANAGDAAKVAATLPSDSENQIKAVIYANLADVLARTGRQQGAKAAATKAMQYADAYIVANPRRNSLGEVGRHLVGVLALLNSERFEVVKASSYSPGADIAEITTHAFLRAGDVQTALTKAAEMSPPKQAQFFLELAQDREANGDKATAAALYLQAAKADPPQLPEGESRPDLRRSDPRFIQTSGIALACFGLQRCGARTVAAQLIAEMSPSDPRRQYFLETIVQRMIKEGNYASAISAAQGSGALMLAAEAQLAAGLNADAADNLKTVASSIPKLLFQADERNRFEQAEQRKGLMFELAKLRIRAGDGEGGLSHIVPYKLEFKAQSHASRPATAMGQLRQRARLFARAGRMDQAKAHLKRLVDLNREAAELRANRPNPQLVPTEGPDRYTSVIEADYAHFLYASNNEADAAKMFERAIETELSVMKEIESNAPARTNINQRKPASLMIYIAKARLDAGDLDGLLKMYDHPMVAAYTTFNRNDSWSEQLYAAEHVAIALARADRLEKGLNVLSDEYYGSEARPVIAQHCIDTDNPDGAIKALIYTRSSNSRSSDAVANTPELILLQQAAKAADPAILADYVNRTNGYGLRVIARARIKSGDKATAINLIEQGLEQAVVQNRQVRLEQLIGLLNKVGETKTANAVQQLIDETGGHPGGVLYAGDGGNENEYGQPKPVSAVGPNVDVDVDAVVKAIAAAPTERDKQILASQSMQRLAAPVAAFAPSTRNYRGSPKVFVDATDARIFEQVKSRWIRLESPPVILAGEQESTTKFTSLADAVRSYRKKNQYTIPSSLQSLASAENINLQNLIGDALPSIEWVPNLPLDAGPKVILLYDKNAQRGGEHTIITVPGLVEKISKSELDHRLANPPKVPIDRSSRKPHSKETRWAAYGDPAVVVNRLAFLPTDKLADRELKNLHNLTATLRAYAMTHNGSFPNSFVELKQSGLLIHAEDLKHPHGETYGYTLLEGIKLQQYGAGPLVIDHSQFQDKIATRINSIRMRIAMTDGTIGTYASNYFFKGTPSIPPVTHTVAPDDDIDMRTRKKMINLHAALHKYAKEHNDQFPPTLMTLVKDGYVANDKALRSERNPNVGFTYIAKQHRAINPTRLLFFDPIPSKNPFPKTIYASLVAVPVIIDDPVHGWTRSANQNAIPLAFGDSPTTTKPPVQNGETPSNVDWNVTFANAPRPADHPLNEICDRLHEISVNNRKVICGVSYGPKFQRPSDEHFTAFVFQVRLNMQMLNPMAEARKVIAMPGNSDRSDPRFVKVMLAGSGFSRFSSGGSQGMQTLAYVRGEGDRCVAYWLVGTPADIGLIDNALGKATWKSNKEPSRWKNTIASKPWQGDLTGQERWKQLEKIKIDDDSPLKDNCDEYRQLGTWEAGIKIGPKVLSTNELDFGRYQAQLLRDIRAYVGDVEVKKSFSGHVLVEDRATRRRRVREYHVATASMKLHRLVVTYGVENGRFVVYWMYGPVNTPATAPLGAGLLLRKD